MVQCSDFTPTIKTINTHLMSQQLVRPDLAAAIVVTDHANPWEYGALSNDIVPASSITDRFMIHYIDVTANNNDEYQLALVAGASTIICEVTFTRAGVQNISFPQDVTTEMIAANTQIRAKVATSAGGGSTCDVKIALHTHP